MFSRYYLLLLLIATVTNAQIDTSNCTNFTSNIDKCNTDNKLSSKFNTEREIISSFLSDPSEVCGSEREKLKAVGSCIINTIRGCGSGEFLKLYTSTSGFTEALDYACSNTANYDPACLNQVEYLLCTNTRAIAANLTKVPVGADFQQTKQYYCSNEEFKKKCLEWNSGLDTCRKPNTKHIHIQIEKLIGAEICNSSPGRPTLTSGLVMVAISLVFMSSSVL